MGADIQHFIVVTLGWRVLAVVAAVAAVACGVLWLIRVFNAQIPREWDDR